MKKWYEEECQFEIEVTGFLRGDHTEHYCRNGEEIGDKDTCTYGCPVNEQGYGICPKMMQLLFADMQAVRSGGDLINVGGKEKDVKEYVCPDVWYRREEGIRHLFLCFGLLIATIEKTKAERRRRSC